MIYDFDEIIDRKNTNSLKYDFIKEKNRPEDILPLWVADMDFKTPPEVTKALLKVTNHSIYGYTEAKEEYFDALHNWFLDGFHFDVRQEWLVKTPGIVFAIAMAVRAFTKEGEGVLIQTPVYYPFSETIRLNKRKVVNNSLLYTNGKYKIDFQDFEDKIIKNHIKLFILCSPHNPVGRVWTHEELLKMGTICRRHDCLVVSDEIHCDFTYSGYEHQIFTTVSPDFIDFSIICTAPSKTFNLAGLQVSNIFIQNKTIRNQFKNEIAKTGYSQLNTVGLTACQSAYEHGREWLSQLITYLYGNLTFLREFLHKRLPMIKLVEPEGTYLVWLDCKELGLSQHDLDAFIVNNAKLWLDGGTMFGTEGEGFQRVNIACPRAFLEKSMIQLEHAIHHL